VRCELGDLAAGATATATVTVAPPQAGDITNRASVEAAELDPDPADNAAAETTAVVPRCAVDHTVAASSKGLRVKAGSLDPVSVDKVSDPRVCLFADGAPTAPTVSETTHPAGQNDCAAADDPGAGTLNRTVTVSPTLGGSATVYLLVQFVTTTPAGASTLNTVEPFGPFPGATFSSPPTGGGEVPVHLCVF
jgi:hypothetical protein